MQLSLPERTKVKRITEAGPITQEEFEYAREKCNGKKRPIGYFLSVIEGQRAEAAEEASKPAGAGPAKLTGDEAMIARASARILEKERRRKKELDDAGE